VASATCEGELENNRTTASIEAIPTVPSFQACAVIVFKALSFLLLLHIYQIR
jgi:hypothetical protein